MQRNNIINEIEEKDLINLLEIFKTVLNISTNYEKIKNLYNTVKDNKDIYILGYYINDSLVGTVTLNVLTLTSTREATIWDLAVKEEYRRLGIASKLMNRAEEIAKGYGDITKIWLFSGFHRESAHELYRELEYDENRDKAFVKVI